MTESALTFVELYTRVQEVINNANATVLGYLKKWMNDTYYEVNSMEMWPYLRIATPATFDLTAGAGYVHALPTGFINFEEHGLYRDDGTELIYATKEQIKSLDPDNSGTALVPTHWYIPYPGYVGIHPKLPVGSTANVTGMYYGDVAALSGDSDVPLIPQQFRVSLLVCGTAARYFVWRKELDSAQIYQAQYRTAIDRLKRQQGITDDLPGECTAVRWDNDLNILDDVD